MISSTYKILNTTAPCKTFYCTIWSKFPNRLTIRQKTYKTLMKWTPFLSPWEEQRHLLVWVGLGRVGKKGRLGIESLSGNPYRETVSLKHNISLHETKSKYFSFLAIKIKVIVVRITSVVTISLVLFSLNSDKSNVNFLSLWQTLTLKHDDAIYKSISKNRMSLH